MKLAQIIAKLDVPKRTLYRWMDKHPNVGMEDGNSLLGHPFPKPVRKEGKENIWDASEVIAWWNDNATMIGRHPLESSTIIIPWGVWRDAWVKAEVYVERDEHGEPTGDVEDDMKMVKDYHLDGENVRLKFRTASDAVKFKLRYF